MATAATNNAFSLVSDPQAVALLAFIGGFYSVLGYLKLQGIFTSSITGNLVVACASSERIDGATSRSVVGASFLLSGLFCALIVFQLKNSLKWNARQLALSVFSIEMACFIVVWIIGMRWDHLLIVAESPDEWIVCLVGSLMGIAMGAHNIASREAIPNCPATTFMTGTLVNVSTTASNYISYLAKKCCLSYSNSNDVSEEARTIKANEIAVVDALVEDSLAKFISAARPIASFAAGAVSGSFIEHYGSWHATAVVIILLAFLMGCIVHKEMQERENKHKTLTLAAELTQKADSK